MLTAAPKKIERLVGLDHHLENSFSATGRDIRHCHGVRGRCLAVHISWKRLIALETAPTGKLKVVGETPGGDSRCYLNFIG